jgi:hypothetical protein
MDCEGKILPHLGLTLGSLCPVRHGKCSMNFKVLWGGIFCRVLPAPGPGGYEDFCTPRSTAMHIHPNQINANAQLDALYAADKAAAKREAENTRRKLMEFASEISGDVEEEDCIVQLGAHEEGQQQQRQRTARWKKQKEQGDSEDKDHSVSDWA